MADTAFASFMSDRLAALRTASGSERAPMVAGYLNDVVRARNAGALPLHNAAYSIVSAVSYLEGGDCDAIGALAGELELAPDPASEDFERQWLELVTLIDSNSRNL